MTTQETVEKGKLIQAIFSGTFAFLTSAHWQKWFLVQVGCLATSYAALAIPPGFLPPCFSPR
jgi:hypothetical protein